MKKILLLFLGMAALLTACQKEGLVSVQESADTLDDFSYTFSLGELPKAALGTKAFAWESGDKMGYFAGSTVNGLSDITVGSSSTPSRFTVTSSSAISAGSKIYCYYPWSSATGSNPASVTMRIPSCQVQPGDDYDADAMPQVGLPFLVTSGMASGTVLDVMPMCNLGAILRFDVLTNDAGIEGTKLYSVSLDSEQAGLSGNFTFNLTAVKYYDATTLAISGLSGTHVETQVSDITLSSTAQSVWMVVAPGTFSGTVKVMTNRGIYAFDLSSHTFTRNTVKPFTLDLANAGTVWHRMVETVAGSGTAGSVDGIGTAATLNSPQGIVVGPDGKLWFTQRAGRHSIRTLDPSTKLVSVVAHNVTYTWMGNYPWNGSFDSEGDYWFCLKGAGAAPILGRIDGSTHKAEGISDIDVPGTITEGSYTTDQMAVQFDANNRMYVLWRKAANAGGSLIRQYSGTTLLTQWTIPSQLGTLATSSDKTWLIAGTEAATAGQSYLYRVATNGTYTAIAGTGTGHSNVGNYTDGDAGNPFSATLGLLEGIYMDAKGWIWWSESSATCAVIRVLIPGDGGDYTKGTVHTMAGVPYRVGSDRSTADLSTFYRSNGLCGYGSEGDIYVCEGVDGQHIDRIFLEEQE